MVYKSRISEKKPKKNKKKQQQRKTNTNAKLNTLVTLNYLQLKHPQSVFPKILTLFLNSKVDLLYSKIVPYKRT